MRAYLTVVWLSFLSGCSSGEGDKLFSAGPAKTGTGGTGPIGAGDSSVSGAGGTGSQGDGATAAGGSGAGGNAGASSGGTSGTGGVTGSGGVAGSGGANGSGGADASGGVTGSGGVAGDGGPGTSDDAGCGFTGCACPPACECDNHGGHRYAFCATLQTWASASAACASAGARLVRVDDAPENGWLLGRAPTAGVTITNGMWLGASDAGAESAWRWEDGDPFWDDKVSGGAGAPVGGLYSNWHGPTPPFAAAEPNNTGGALGGVGEDCGMMRSDGTWNDGSCSATAGYVCEAY